MPNIYILAGYQKCKIFFALKNPQQHKIFKLNTLTLTADNSIQKKL